MQGIEVNKLFVDTPLELHMSVSLYYQQWWWLLGMESRSSALKLLCTVCSTSIMPLVRSTFIVVQGSTFHAQQWKLIENPTMRFFLMKHNWNSPPLNHEGHFIQDLDDATYEFDEVRLLKMILQNPFEGLNDWEKFGFHYYGIGFHVITPIQTLGHEEVVGLAFEKRTPSLSLTLQVEPNLLIIERVMMKIVDTSIFHSEDKDLGDF
jgi:hypothetical protein